MAIEIPISYGPIKSLIEDGTRKSFDSVIKFLDREHNVIRANAVSAIGYLCFPDSGEYVSRLFKDKDERVRRMAALAIIESRSKKYFPSAFSILEKTRYSEVVETSPFYVLDLAYINGPGVEEFCLNSFKSRNEDDRRFACTVVAIRNMKEAIGPLIDILSTDPDNNVRHEAARALSIFGGKRVIQPLISRLEDFDYQVRISSLQSLLRLKDSINEKQKKQLKAVIHRFLDYPVNPFIGVAIQAAGELRFKDTKDKLLKILWNTEQYSNECIQALRKIGDKKVAGGLLDYMALTGRMIYSIVDYLLWADRKKYEQEIVNLIKNKNIPDRENAILALVNLRDKKHSPLLYSMYKEESHPFVKGRALRGMARLRHPKAKGLVKELLLELLRSDRSEMVQSMYNDIIRAASNLSKELIDELLVLIKTDLPYGFKTTPLDALGKLKNKKAVDGICDALEEGKIRPIDAIKAFKNSMPVNKNKMVKSMYGMLFNDKYSVSAKRLRDFYRMVDLLVELDNKQAVIENVNTYLNDESVVVRRKATFAKNYLED